MEYESVLLVKNEVYLYRIPPRPSNRGYRAMDWGLESPSWTGRLRIITKGKDLVIKLEDRQSGTLYAQCPVDDYPGIAVESVLDSSRYFVIRLVSGTGSTAFVGIGFAERSDSFDFNVAIQDHFKWVKRENEANDTESSLQPQPSLNLGFKEGQTIKLNLNTRRTGDDNPETSSNAKPRTQGSTKPSVAPLSGGLLPPPPSAAVTRPRGSRTAPITAPGSTGTVSAKTDIPSARRLSGEADVSNASLLMDVFGSNKPSGESLQQQQHTKPAPVSWADFQ